MRTVHEDAGNEIPAGMLRRRFYLGASNTLALMQMPDYVFTLYVHERVCLDSYWVGILAELELLWVDAIEVMPFAPPLSRACA